jgi:uncharacterized membrane protein
VTTRTKTFTYGSSAALLAFVLLSGGAAYLAHQADAAAGAAYLLRHVLVPIALAIVALVSWATRPAGRTLGANP